MALNRSQTSPGLSWHISALRRPVRQLQRAIAFYTQGLGFELERQPSNIKAMLRLGDERIELFECERLSLGNPGVSGPDVRFQHAAIVAADMDCAFQRLAPLMPLAITHSGPQRLPAVAGGVEAFKFFDPDGHPLELIWFPSGIGDARWQHRTRIATTLGIDHFALSVSDVQRSTSFYERTLGLKISAQQTNRGAAQARLDGLYGLVSAEVTVEVVALTAERGSPHIELLCYRKPPSIGRASSHYGDAVDCLVLERVALKSELFSGSQTSSHQDPDGHLLECNVICTPQSLLGLPSLPPGKLVC